MVANLVARLGEGQRPGGQFGGYPPDSSGIRDEIIDKMPHYSHSIGQVAPLQFNGPSLSSADLTTPRLETSMFITPAHAQGLFGGEGGGLGGLFPIILIFVVFYFLLIRPQQKKVKQHREMLGMVKRGDRILTGGGIVGTVTRIKDNDELIVEIADGVKITVLRGTLSDVLNRSEPASGGGAPGGPTVVGPGGQKSGGLLGGLLGGKK